MFQMCISDYINEDMIFESEIDDATIKAINIASEKIDKLDTTNEMKICYMRYKQLASSFAFLINFISSAIVGGTLGFSLHALSLEALKRYSNTTDNDTKHLISVLVGAIFTGIGMFSMSLFMRIKLVPFILKLTEKYMTKAYGSQHANPEEKIKTLMAMKREMLNVLAVAKDKKVNQTIIVEIENNIDKCNYYIEKANKMVNQIDNYDLIKNIDNNNSTINTAINGARLAALILRK